MRNKKLLSRFNSQKGKGKEFSNVANQTEELFNAWLSSSCVEDEALQKHLDSEGFNINSHDSKGFAYVSLEVDDKPIALPFIWHGMMGTKKIDFYTDVMLLIFYLLGKMKNENNKKLVEEKLQDMKNTIM